MNVDGNATISKEYVSQTNPADLSESNPSDPASREEESSKEIISSGPVPRKNDSSEMNSSDNQLKPQCPPPPGLKVLRDEDRDSLQRHPTQTLENVLQLCELDQKGILNAGLREDYERCLEHFKKDGTESHGNTVHHLVEELRRRQRAGAKLEIYSFIDKD